MKKAFLIILAVAAAGCARRGSGSTPEPTNALKTALPTQSAGDEKHEPITKDPNAVTHGLLQRLDRNEDLVVTALRLDGDRCTEDNVSKLCANGIRSHFEPGETVTAYFEGSISEAAEGRVTAMLLARRNPSGYAELKPADLEREALFTAEIPVPGEDGFIFSRTVPESAETGDYDLVFFLSGLAVWRVAVKITSPN